MVRKDEQMTGICVAAPQTLAEFRSEFAHVEAELIRSRHNLYRLKEQEACAMLNGGALLKEHVTLVKRVRHLAQSYLHLFYWVHQLEVRERQRSRIVRSKVRRLDGNL